MEGRHKDVCGVLGKWRQQVVKDGMSPDVLRADLLAFLRREGGRERERERERETCRIYSVRHTLGGIISVVLAIALALAQLLGTHNTY